MNISFEQFVEIIRKREIYRHSHELAIDTIENGGRNMDTLMLVHREMMSKIDNREFMYNEYLNFIKG